MLHRVLFGNVANIRQAVCMLSKRQIGVSAVVLQKTQNKLDPIQQLYLTKLKEYVTKSKAAGGAMVDINPKTEKDLKDEIDRLSKLYGGGDMTKFPDFKFTEVDYNAPAK